ncbi:MAG: TIM barrel protein [Chloroflexi bacterium]|jgi:sugar phosphate isomerase/epimerase|nr:TIM barrel protein [Chloroflexota bacterium]
MGEQRRIRFAADLCTFYAPAFWGAPEGFEMATILDGRWEPLPFWERILDSAREAGLDGLEITFAPGDWHAATRAYGSAAGFRSALDDRGLALASGFMSSRIPGANRYAHLADAQDRPLLVDMAAAYAEFLAACGAELMVVSLPIRKTRSADPPLYVDLGYASLIADTLNRMGAATLRQGVRLVLHPEAFTAFRSSRDADLFMLLTDPTYVGMCPDTAQFTVAGSDPLEIVRRHRDRVALTHWKDAVGPAPLDVPIDDTIFARQVQWFAGVGTGVVDWPGWLRLLREIGYQGWAVFELDNAPDPVAALQAIKRYVEGALLHIYR